MTTDTAETLPALKPRNTNVVAVQEMELRTLAREIAMDIVDIETILKSHALSVADFTKIAETDRFQKLLRDEAERWHSSPNTRERVELRTWSMLEEFLPQAWDYLHNPGFSDTAKVQLFQALQKQVGIGQKDAAVSGGEGQRVSITINMSKGNQVKVDTDVTPEGKLIEGEVVNG